jgi:hypothetical protein
MPAFQNRKHRPPKISSLLRRFLRASKPASQHGATETTRQQERNSTHQPSSRNEQSQETSDTSHDIGRFQQAKGTESDSTDSESSNNAQERPRSERSSIRRRRNPHKLLRSSTRLEEEDTMPPLIQRRNSFSDDEEEVATNTASARASQNTPMTLKIYRDPTQKLLKGEWWKHGSRYSLGRPQQDHQISARRSQI